MLYRPVGIEELLLVYRAGMRGFPPRLPDQDIFYPVLNLLYAEEIAERWNAPTGSQAGYVTEFEVEDAVVATFPKKQVGSSRHEELWVPKEALDDFNRSIFGKIRVVRAYFGPGFRGITATATSLKGKGADAQLVALWGIYKYSLMDFHGEITANHEAVFVHMPYWERHAVPGLSDDDRQILTAEIHKVWRSASPDLPLGIERPRS